ncbi:hypothetical protein LXL04_004126 [Taraxacum kok-saghyz]
MANRKGCTTAQLALAWLHHLGNNVIPIPGITKIENFNQNIRALAVKLTPEEMAELESFASGDMVKGERNPMMHLTWCNSETPLLSSWNAHQDSVKVKREKLKKSKLDNNFGTEGSWPLPGQRAVERCLNSTHEVFDGMLNRGINVNVVRKQI